MLNESEKDAKQTQVTLPTDSASTNTAKNELNAVSVRLPPFWAHSPCVWFIQAEAQFALGRISSEYSKYNYVVASLPQDVAESIADFLQDSFDDPSYSKLKEVLISRHSLSVERSLQKILSDESMGDRSPSEFYRALKRLAGSSNTLGDDLIKKIWLQRLPHLVNISLISHKETEDIAKILSLADQIWEAMASSNVSTVSKCHVTSNDNDNNSKSDETIKKLETEISELKQLVYNMNQNRSRSHSRNRSNVFRRRSTSRNKFNKNHSLCWYHFKFGNKATKCTSPCSKSTQNTEANSKN